jgi:hypothetical protein
MLDARYWILDKYEKRIPFRNGLLNLLIVSSSRENGAKGEVDRF